MYDYEDKILNPPEVKEEKQQTCYCCGREFIKSDMDYLFYFGRNRWICKEDIELNEIK